MWPASTVFANSEAGKIVDERVVDVHGVLAVDDCVACVDTFVEIVSLIVLLVRHEAEKSQCEAIEGK